MNVTPVVDGKNINLYTNGIKQTTIHGINSVGTPYTVGNNVIVQVKVGDNLGRIVATLKSTLEQTDAVIICGGLGPTHDDITREAIAEIMGVELEMNDEVALVIEQMFTARNRRWMLYPFSMVWGHGSTKSQCVLWALDDSRTRDTLYYSSNFIAWPYNGYINKMFLFKKWSFSIYNDLKDAQVIMMIGKVPIKLKLETAVEGYGLPTLVWTPELDTSKLKEGDKIDVTIKLNGNKTYYYTVKLFDFTP